ncbi:MAG: GntP family permease, partial [Negativicutes bacterium]|nr:GntP family permease [Negativicutes bacterium]
MDIFSIVLSLALLMFFAYRGFSVIIFAPIFAILAAVLSGKGALATYTHSFMPEAMNYAKVYFPIFMLGAVFGKVMEETGLAKSVAMYLIKTLGKERGILSIILSCVILTYGGVSLFVVVFAVYPFAASLFKEADIPKRLMPVTIALGAFTATMDSFPWSPQIQNVIPTTFYGTTTAAAPISGFIGGTLILVLGYLYVNWRVKQARANGEGYGVHDEKVVDQNAQEPISFCVAIIPLASVLLINLFLTSRFFVWDPNLLADFPGVSVNSIKGIWALIIA